MTNKQALREAAEKHGDDDILALLDELEDYKAAYEEYARDKEVQRSVIDHALCKLLPGCQYMDPPDGGSVTPLEQVRRMVDDYRERIAELEAREVTLPRPACTYADHSYPAYSKRQVVALLESLGIRINGEG